MADDVKVTNWPKDGSAERVALELAQTCMQREGYDAFTTREAVLTLYAQCIRTVVSREYKPAT